MNQTMCMSGRQPRGDLRTDAEYLLQFQRAFRIHLFPQRVAIDVFHHEVGVFLILLHSVNGYHVRVRDGGGGLRFSQKPFARGGVGSELRQARRSAWFVNVAGLAMAFACAGWLF